MHNEVLTCAEILPMVEDSTKELLGEYNVSQCGKKIIDNKPGRQHRPRL